MEDAVDQKANITHVIFDMDGLLLGNKVYPHLYASHVHNNMFNNCLILGVIT